ncbi:hypothetical protein [Achromobacter denitrificans]|uniref:hypothetical protein n=1 Tax=Achromobacter denitrificans TaxID=32002 RepID=UPI001124CC5E|nr:hypothetical protein [Achromobacter denitrificans]
MPFSHSSPYAQLTPRQQACIGRFVTEWANAEFYLGILLGRLLGTPEYLARTYTDFLGAVQIQQAITQALEIHHHRYGDRLIQEALAKEVAGLSRRIDKLRSLRNKFAHYYWMRNTDEGMYGTPLSGASPYSKRGSRSDIETTVAEIDSAHDELFAVNSRLEEIVAEIPAVPEETYIAPFKGTQMSA